MGRMLGKILICILCMASALRISAQELKCTVDVNASQVSGTTSTFETLKQAISEYMNTTAFSTAQFAENEKIECQLFLTVKSYDDNTVKGELQIQSTRPVYNSSYTTPIINFRDTKIDFEYQEGDPLVFSTTDMESQLTALLNYYAYLILAMDFDSFSPRGGDAYWDILKRITLQGQNSGQSGWKAFEDNRNRAAVLAVFTEPSTEILRDLLYQYHRQGLDQMALVPDKGRNVIHQALGYLERVQKAAPMSVGLVMFKDAKLQELASIYSNATSAERKDAYELLQKLYPSETDLLEKIRLGEK